MDFRIAKICGVGHVGAASGSRYILSRRCDYAIITEFRWCLVEDSRENDKNMKLICTGIYCCKNCSRSWWIRSENNDQSYRYSGTYKENLMASISFHSSQQQPPIGEFRSKVSNFKISKRRRKQQTVLLIHYQQTDSLSIWWCWQLALHTHQTENSFWKKTFVENLKP